jgi:hypothetical protein
VGRFRFWLAILFALSAIVGTLVDAQLTNEEKRAQFLKARATASPTPDESPSPAAKAKAAKQKSKTKKEASPSPKPKAKPTPSETPEPTESPSPSAKPKASPHKPKSGSPSPKAKKMAEEATPTATPKETPEATPKKKSAAKEATPKAKKKKKGAAKPEKSPTPRKHASPKPSETPEIRRAVPVPRASALPVPTAPPAPRSTYSSGPPREEPEQLTIEKYGYEKPRGFWERLFGGGGRSNSSGAGYRYLTTSVRAAIDRAPADRRNPRWQLIVVHNSGTRQGNAVAFDYYHRHVRHMQNGLAYHFVIGNGTSTGNGQIEVGDRWRRQINGGHVHSDYLNNIALGICLVGDFNRDQPTRAQLDCCEELIRYLRQRCGKIDNHYPIVKPHREVNPPRWATDCPGDVFPYSWFRRFQ